MKVPAAGRFLSCEPLLEALDLSAFLPIEWSDIAEDWIEAWPGVDSYEKKLHWIICGGESGSHSRECHIEWLLSVVSQCQAAKIKVFVKQLGSNPMMFGKTFKVKYYHGGNIDEFPEGLIREFPEPF